MLRSVLSVIAGSAIWTVLWLTSNQAILAALPGYFRPDGTTDSTGVLLLILVLSVIYSVIAGFVTAAVAARSEMRHALALGILQLIFGIIAQSQFWDVMPLWYHLIFLALLIPGNLAGGKLRLTRKLKVSPA